MKSNSFSRMLQSWSKEVRSRDDNKCVVCGRDKYVQAHHILPKKYYREYALELDCGISLCPKHHCFGACSAHMNAIWFSNWLFEHRPKQYKWALEKMKEHLEKHA